MVTACEDCNRKKSNQSLEEFLRDEAEKLKRLLSQMKKSFISATYMNHLMPLILNGLEEMGLPIAESDAVETAHTRKRLGVPKTHVNDAACLGDPETISGITEIVTVIRAIGHGKRQMLNPLRANTALPGTPPDPEGETRATGPTAKSPETGRGSPPYPDTATDRKGSRESPAETWSGTPTPLDGTATGYATLEGGKTRVRADGKRSMGLRAATLLGRGNGYRYETDPNQE